MRCLWRKVWFTGSRCAAHEVVLKLWCARDVLDAPHLVHALPAHHSPIVLWGCECPYPFMFSVLNVDHTLCYHAAH